MAPAREIGVFRFFRARIQLPSSRSDIDSRGALSERAPLFELPPFYSAVAGGRPSPGPAAYRAQTVGGPLLCPLKLSIRLGYLFRSGRPGGAGDLSGPHAGRTFIAHKSHKKSIDTYRLCLFNLGPDAAMPGRAISGRRHLST